MKFVEKTETQFENKSKHILDKFKERKQFPKRIPNKLLKQKSRKHIPEHRYSRENKRKPF